MLKLYHYEMFYNMNSSNTDRISRDEYYMILAASIGLRSSCKYFKEGAVIVRDNRILGTGYNGNPIGEEECLTLGCKFIESGYNFNDHIELCTACFAIQNALINSSNVSGSVIYLSMFDVNDGCFVKNTPNSICRQLCINAGITEYITGFPIIHSNL